MRREGVDRDRRTKAATPPLDSLSYGPVRSVLIIGDTAAARARAAEAPAAAGMRIAGEVDLGGAVDRLDRQARTGSVIVEISGERLAPDEASAFERLLVRLDAEAAAGRFASLVSTPASMIDLVSALAPHSRVHQLADASDGERVMALALADGPATLSFHSAVAEDADTARLRHLTDEVGRIASALARLSAPSWPVARPPAPQPEEAIDAEEIRGMIRARRMRARYFDAELFADPAWDMLLDLAAAHADQQRVAVSSLCIAAAVPATTALRWIKTLTDMGLLVRRADPTDGRRVFIELGESAARGMRGYLSAVKRLANAPGMGLAQVAI